MPDDDDQAMTEAIHRLLDHPELAGRLSVNGRRLAESVSWEHLRPQWEGLFADLMARANHGGLKA